MNSDERSAYAQLRPFKHWAVKAWGTGKVKNTLRWLLVYTSYNSGPTTRIHEYGSPEVLEHEEAEMRSITLLTCVSSLSLYHTHTHNVQYFYTNTYF